MPPDDPDKKESYRIEIPASDSLEALHAELESLGVVPGWARPGRPPMWNSPASKPAPSYWSFAAARKALERAGGLVDTELAERRNLILANRQLESHYPTVSTLVLAYQSILPGERARIHRHSPHAGRLILEADDDAYTVVDGTSLPMHVGDVVLTPGGSWHGHGHNGKKPAYWLDFLDVPLVQLLEPMFFEILPGGWEDPTQEGGRPDLLFTWEETVRRLDEAEATKVRGPIGVGVELGHPALPTIGLSMHRLSAGEATAPYRTTANYQFCVAEGSGRSRVNKDEYAWSRGDVVVVPCWNEQVHFSETGAVLLCVSDEPLQRYCGYLRSEYVNGEKPLSVATGARP